MKKAFQLLIALGTVLWGGAAFASQNWVMINLSEQRAYLVERGMVTLISPIASGKPGWSTPTDSFSILTKDVDHRSGSFGSVVDAAGRVAIQMRPLQALYPGVVIFDPRKCHTTWNLAQQSECMRVTCQVIPHPMAAFGCPEIWLPDSLSEFRLVLR